MGKYQFDFAAIKNDYPIEVIAERLGLELKRVGTTLRGPCPSGEGGDRALVITPAKKVFYSFAKQTGGDCLALVSFVQGVGAKEAAAWIVGETHEPEKKKPSEGSVAAAEEPSEGFRPLEYLVPDHEAVIAIGFQPDDAARLGIGYCPRGVLRGTVAIPVRDCKGRLAGYVGITEAKLPSRWHL